MAMAGNRVGATGRFNHNIGPNHSGANMHGRNLSDSNAFLVAAE
jgi:hypothetical protein